MDHEHDHNHDMCKIYFEKLSEFIDNELPDADCQAIKNHLKTCDCCSACLDTLKKTIELCANLKDRPVPHELANRIKNLFFDISVDP